LLDFDLAAGFLGNRINGFFGTDRQRMVAAVLLAYFIVNSAPCTLVIRKTAGAATAKAAVDLMKERRSKRMAVSSP